MYNETMIPESKARQEEYVEKQRQSNSGIGLVFADAFLRGMRDIGYKSPAMAVCEMIDNAVQAQANVIEVVFGDINSERGGDRLGQIAIVDNGVGMIPDMISYAVRWGGTDRENDRHGFGRYGYGLPSSAVSMAKRYSVYSMTAGGKWFRVLVDIEDLAAVAGDLDKINKKLQPVQENPPDWVYTRTANLKSSKVKSGTMIILEDLDRLQNLKGWKSCKAIKAKFSEQFGLTYRHWLPEPRIIVDGEEIDVVDPLFLKEHGRNFDETEVMAKPIDARSFTVISERGEEAKVTIRASYLPPNFQLVDNKTKLQVGKTNKRFKIMKANNGIHICRDGREIDCIRPEWTTFQNYDRNVKIEIDFDAELDEFFGITTAKQQITINDDMWDRLKNRGKIVELVKDIRLQHEFDRKRLIATREQPNEAVERSSERAMKESKGIETKTKVHSERHKAEGQRNLERAATRISETERRSREEVIARLENEAQERPFKVDFSSVAEGPIYRPHRLGVQKILTINTDHPFYEKVYSVAPEVRAGLEVLLFVLAESELDADGEYETFYKAARQHWSERLRHALEKLQSDESVIDAASVAAAMAEVEMVEKDECSRKQ